MKDLPTVTTKASVHDPRQVAIREASSMLKIPKSRIRVEPISTTWKIIVLPER